MMNAFESMLLLFSMDDASLSEDSTILFLVDKACSPMLASSELILLLMLLHALSTYCPVTDDDPADVVRVVLAAALMWMNHSNL